MAVGRRGQALRWDLVICAHVSTRVFLYCLPCLTAAPCYSPLQVWKGRKGLYNPLPRPQASQEQILYHLCHLQLAQYLG